MIRRPPRSTRTDTLFPYTTLFRSQHRKNATRRCLPLDLISPGTAGNLLQPAARPDCYGYSCASCDVYGCTVREAGCRMRPLPAPGTRAARDGFKQLPPVAAFAPGLDDEPCGSSPSAIILPASRR